jgi:8-hydroxy-5-deazaflavin:NADPH oxidoreductase
MKVGIIGSGDVAKTLGSGFLKHGHQVTLGTRNPSKLKEWKKTNSSAHTGSFADAASFGDIVVLAVKGRAAAQALEAAGEQNLRSKTVIDVTNPTEDAPPNHGVLQFFTGPNESLMEALQAKFPHAHFVKAFNSVGSDRMVDPQFKEGRPTMFFCGGDEHAKAQVARILDDFGWEAADMGGPEAARAIEPLSMLWCIPGFLQDDWTHAFKMLH